jgi:hypothetical protein
VLDAQDALSVLGVEVAQNIFSGLSELSTRFRRAANFVRNNVALAVTTPNTGRIRPR